MVKVQMDKRKAGEYFNLVFPNPRDPEDEKGLARARQNRELSAHFYHEGKGNKENGEKGVSGTLWAAYNGVTEYTDHRKFKNQSENRRLGSIWFGEGYQIKARAFKIAEEKVKAWSN